MHVERAPRAGFARLLAALALGCLVSSCGGATPKAHAPREQADDTPAGSTSGSSDSAPETPQAPSCDDGTCFPCGDGICPKGFYCDRKAAGGPACSWLPDCAKQVSCDCVTKTLGSGCSCNADNGGVYVDCE